VGGHPCRTIGGVYRTGQLALRFINRPRLAAGDWRQGTDGAPNEATGGSLGPR